MVALSAKGLFLSDAVRCSCSAWPTIRHSLLNLESRTPRPAWAMSEAEEIARTRRASFATADELFASLETTGGK